MVLTAKNSTFTQLSLTHKYTFTQSIKCQTYVEPDQPGNTEVSTVDALGLPGPHHQRQWQHRWRLSPNRKSGPV